MWRSQRARESIITYRYELAPDTAWYLSMRLHLLWCDASIPNDICYAISVRFIFPTLTSTSHSLYLHTGGRKDSLFCQCWSFELWASMLSLSYNPRFPGDIWMFSSGDWTLHCPVHCPGKTEHWNYFWCLPQGQPQGCSLQASITLELWVPCGDWRNSWLRRGNTDLTSPQTRPANLHVSLQYRNQFHHSQKPQLDHC